MALVDLETVKHYLGIEGNDQDTFLQSLIDRASAAIEKQAKRHFEYGSYTDTRDGGGEALILRNRPVDEITAIRDFANPNEPVIVNAEKYTLYREAGYVVNATRGSGIPWPHESWYAHWPDGYRRWEVTYKGGFDPVPGDIVQAALFTVELYYNDRSGGAYQSESLGDYSYTLSESAIKMGLPASAQAIVERYMEVDF